MHRIADYSDWFLIQNKSSRQESYLQVSTGIAPISSLFEGLSRSLRVRHPDGYTLTSVAIWIGASTGNLRSELNSDNGGVPGEHDSPPDPSGRAQSELHQPFRRAG